MDSPRNRARNAARRRNTGRTGALDPWRPRPTRPIIDQFAQKRGRASLQTGGAVQVGWQKDRDALRLWVEDQGPGLPKTDHLFVPFFTTKQNGTEIGLVVSRQIAEVHGGALHLENNADGKGCKAILELPL